MHAVCVNPLKDRARVNSPQDCRLVYWNHLDLRIARRAPTKNYPGTADVKHAIGLDGDLGSLSFHAASVITKDRQAGFSAHRCLASGPALESAASAIQITGCIVLIRGGRYFNGKEKVFNAA